MAPHGWNWLNEIKESTWFPFIFRVISIKLLLRIEHKWQRTLLVEFSSAADHSTRQWQVNMTGRSWWKHRKGSVNSRFTSLCLFFSLTILFWGSFARFFGGRQSYQTGIHHKSTPSPELVQLPAPQGHRQAGEESARHQVEQSRLAHLHHGQRHEGDEQAYAVRCRERRRSVEVRWETHIHRFTFMLKCWLKIILLLLLLIPFILYWKELLESTSSTWLNIILTQQ